MAALTNDYKLDGCKVITLSMEYNAGGQKSKAQGNGRRSPSDREDNPILASFRFNKVGNFGMTRLGPILAPALSSFSLSSDSY